MNTMYGKMHGFCVQEGGMYSSLHALKVYWNYIGNVLWVATINVRIWITV